MKIGAVLMTSSVKVPYSEFKLPSVYLISIEYAPIYEEEVG
jgi:hypothetical protein